MDSVEARIAGLSDARWALLERRLRAPAPGPGEDAAAIAVTGIGCRLPGGVSDPEGFWRLLRDGVDATCEVPADRWDVDAYHDPDPAAAGRICTRRGGFLDSVDAFDAGFFGISAPEAEAMDPQHRLLLEVAWEALERAGLAPGGLAGTRTGVFVGIGTDDYKTLLVADPARVDGHTGTGFLLCAAAGRLSHVLGLRGPSLAVDTACSSSLVAVHLACQSLRAGECDTALAGGVHLMLSPELNIFLSRAGALSPDGRSRTFDAAAAGYGRGEGCGVVVLRRLSDAVAAHDPVLAVVRGSAVNHDGASGGLTVPSGRAQRAVLAEALARAGVRPEQVAYVEAHGTGTALGDPIEMSAIAAELGAGRPAGQPLLVGSVKTNIGHLEMAAGVVGLIKVVLAFQHETIPPHLHLRTPNPRIPWADLPVRVPTSAEPFARGERPRLAGVSSFGISGTNAHVVLAEPPTAAPGGEAGEPERPWHVVPLSARSAAALDELALRHARHLEEQPGTSLADLAHTAGSARSHFEHRLAVVAATADQLRERLAASARGEAVAGVAEGGRRHGVAPRVAFLFTGQGSQYAGMARGLYRTEPAFRRAMDRCDEFLRPLLPRPLLSVLDDGDGAIDETAFTQPALFAVQHALTELWREWGIRPAVVAGHSVGEFAAASAAGVLAPEAAARLVATRGRLMQALPRDGRMAAVLAAEADVAAALRPHGASVSVAAVNGPAETVISGRTGAVDAVVAAFRAAGVRVRALATSHAFHSPLMDPVLDALEREAADVAHGPARVPVVSTVTGALAGPGDLSGAAYWRRNAREPVRFLPAVSALLAHGCDAVLEIGPDPVLTGIARRAALGPSPDRPWLASLRRGGEDGKQIMAAVAALYAAGADLDWEALARGRSRRRLVLPTYPFQRERYWRDTRPSAPAPGDGPDHRLLGRRLQSPALSAVVFERRFDARTPAFLPDHRLFGAMVVPAASHLVVALAAAAAAEDGPRALEEVSFPSALVLDDAASRNVQVIVDRAAFRVVSGAPGNAEPGWTTHAEGAVRAVGEGRAGWAAALAAARGRCRERVTADCFYAALERRGYRAGPRFRLVEELVRDDGAAIARLRTPAAGAGDAGELDPGLLDACFQTASAALPDQEGSLQVPFRLDRFRWIGRAASPVAWCLALRRADEAIDVALLDGEGAAVAELEGVWLRPLSPGALLPAAGPAAELLHELAWRPAAPPAGRPLPAGGWLILKDAGGVGHALAARLRALGATCLVAGASLAARPERVRRLVEDAAAADGAAADGPAGVVFLGGLDYPAGSEACGAAVPDGCAGLLHVAQALAGLHPPPRLCVATRLAQRVRASPPWPAWDPCR